MAQNLERRSSFWKENAENAVYENNEQNNVRLQITHKIQFRSSKRG